MAMDEVIGGRRRGPSFGGPPPENGNIAAAARLAVRFGATVIPAYCLRTGGAHFRVTYERPIPVDPNAPPAEERERLANAINEIVAGWVRNNPEQWLMLHEQPS